MGYESLFTPFKIGNMEVKNRIQLRLGYWI